MKREYLGEKVIVMTEVVNLEQVEKKLFYNNIISKL